ncbi:MAG TPA: hypothetical protein VHV83_20005 [Armatimonadota bacterium]|nr:hypothetical protein [Armatimonadota bacterium]
MKIKTITVNGVMMAVALFVGALLGPRLFPPVTKAEAGTGVLDDIKARHIEIVDEKGNILIALGQAEDDGPTLALFNKYGKQVATWNVDASSNTPYIVMTDDKGAASLKLGYITFSESANRSGSPVLILTDTRTNSMWSAPPLTKAGWLDKNGESLLK